MKSTDIKNNFGKYLKLLDKEDIIVTKNGSPVAKITRHEKREYSDRVCEEAADSYGYGGIRMSYEEFMEMYENTDERYEYIDGEAYLLASSKVTHQRIIGDLYVSFRSWFEGKKCTPYLSPFDVTLKKSEKNINLVQPDLLVICDPENRNHKDKYTGIPSLVVEVLSDKGAKMDLVKKLNLYMQTGIQEYWVVNYFNREVIVCRFKDKDIADMRLFVKEDTAQSFVFVGHPVITHLALKPVKAKMQLYSYLIQG